MNKFHADIEKPASMQAILVDNCVAIFDILKRNNKVPQKYQIVEKK